MKSDSERQIEYQQRRREKEDRIMVWVSKEVEHGMDVLRGDQSRNAWINQAITELTIRQLLNKPFPFSDDEHKMAQERGKPLGIVLPD